MYVVITLWILLLQNTSSPEMADYLRSSGKIYIVVGVLLTIFMGIIFYLLSIGRRLSNLEQKDNKEKI